VYVSTFRFSFEVDVCRFVDDICHFIHDLINFFDGWAFAARFVTSLAGTTGHSTASTTITA
jgi:hypothetical protein